MRKNVSVVLCAALFAVSGCKKEDGVSGARGGSCDDVWTMARKDMMSRIPADAPEDARSIMTAKSNAAAGLIGKRCKDDRWADSVIKCFRDARGDDAARPCLGELTADQHKKLMDDLQLVGGSYAEKPD
jgi:hypothetical protein